MPGRNRRNSFVTHLGFMSQMPTEEEQHQRSSFCNYGRPAYVPKSEADERQRNDQSVTA